MTTDSAKDGAPADSAPSTNDGADATLDPANPFAAPSDQPFDLPPYASIRPEHYLPAFRAGVAAHRAEIDRIIADPADPSFDTVFLPYEDAGRLLGRTSHAFFNQLSADGTDAVQDLNDDVSPLLSKHFDGITLDPAFYAKISAVHSARRDAGLRPEQLRLVELTHQRFVLAGAGLDESGRSRLAEMNARLSKLSTTFNRNLLRSMADGAVRVADRDRLRGLSDRQIESARAAANERGCAEDYLLTLILPTVQPLLAHLQDRSLREEIHRFALERAPENFAVAAEIAALRAERAELLGFPSHAALATADRTAGTPEAVDALLEQIIAPAVVNADRETAELVEVAREDGIDDFSPWDRPFYLERIRAERFDLDAAALSSYFSLERVLDDGVFEAARRLYGLTFTPREDLVGYHPDVRIWEVRDSARGDDSVASIGLFVGDFFMRATKKGGAWMNSLVDQSRHAGTRPVIVNNLNVTKPPAGEPALMTLDEVNTLFHEFGHALHGLLSDVEYGTLSGTSVPRDVVEFPSQVNEMWAMYPDIVRGYARHVETDEPLDPEILVRLDAAALWGEGFRTTEHLAAVVLDQAWHRLAAGQSVADPIAFERTALDSAGLRAAGDSGTVIDPRYRTSYFQHVFSGGYAAGYYSYLWAEVLDADAVAWFHDHGGLRRDNGDRFRDRLLARGGSVDLLDAYRDFRGRAAEIGPLLDRKGLRAS